MGGKRENGSLNYQPLAIENKIDGSARQIHDRRTLQCERKSKKTACCVF